MLRFEVREVGGAELPAVDLDDAVVVIGSAPDAKIRLPASAARPEHVRVIAAEVGDGKTYEIGSYRVRVTPAPPGAVAASPQRTESLARELVRGLLGDAPPVLEIERGPHAGARRMLAPPESVLVIGRGDEAGWIVDDEDLSRAHAEVRRGWDGAWLKDLGSKNGTRLDGARLGADPVALRDGAAIELGNVVMRFRDPAERHLRGELVAAPAPAATPAPVATPAPAADAPARVAEPRQPAVFYAALAVLALALAGLAWVLHA